MSSPEEVGELHLPYHARLALGTDSRAEDLWHRRLVCACLLVDDEVGIKARVAERAFPRTIREELLGHACGWDQGERGRVSVALVSTRGEGGHRRTLIPTYVGTHAGQHFHVLQ